jgi:hypothetical protein
MSLIQLTDGLEIVKPSRRFAETLRGNSLRIGEEPKTRTIFRGGERFYARAVAGMVTAMAQTMSTEASARRLIVAMALELIIVLGTCEGSSVRLESSGGGA